MSVALLVARRDRGDVDGRFDGGLGDVLVIDVDAAGRLAERALDVAHHHVADRERRLAVRWIDVPGSCRGEGRRDEDCCGEEGTKHYAISLKWSRHATLAGAISKGW